MGQFGKVGAQAIKVKVKSDKSVVADQFVKITQRTVAGSVENALVKVVPSCGYNDETVAIGNIVCVPVHVKSHYLFAQVAPAYPESEFLRCSFQARGSA